LTIQTLIKSSQYHDSVTLMLVARELSKLPGVIDAAVVMATDANKSILQQGGLLSDEAKAASPNDLVIAVQADEKAGPAAMAAAEELLQKKTALSESGDFRPRTIRGAVQSHPDANVCVISVAGRYAAGEAWQALRKGLHVLLFSDNVGLEDEIALKTYARDHSLLLMGPGAGTTLLNGVALGFANVVPAGPVGIVSAAGTGLQEVSTLLAKHGVGITQGLGVGGRDLSQDVGGIMMLAALEALQIDPATEVIILVSKPPSQAIAKAVLKQVGKSTKPTVVCLLGERLHQGVPKPASVVPTLQQAAWLGARLAGASLKEPKELLAAEAKEVASRAAEIRGGRKSDQRYLRGLYSGGTLCYEAQVIWRDLGGPAVWSNAPLSKDRHLEDSTRSQEHTVVDLGEEEFTVGRPHPMIDNDLRVRRLHQEAMDPAVAVILLDVVLGYGAHPDPAAELGPAIARAKALAGEQGQSLAIVASITGTEGDPQTLSRQTDALQAAGVELCASNAEAARLAAAIVSPDPKNGASA
jgi:FdrA protein